MSQTAQPVQVQQPVQLAQAPAAPIPVVQQNSTPVPVSYTGTPEKSNLLRYAIIAIVICLILWFIYSTFTKNAAKESMGGSKSERSDIQSDFNIHEAVAELNRDNQRFVSELSTIYN